MPLLAAPQIVSFLGMMIKPSSSFLLGNYAMFKELPGCLTGAKQLKLLSLEDSAGSGIGHWISHETSNMLGKFEIEHGEFLYIFFFLCLCFHTVCALIEFGLSLHCIDWTRPNSWSLDRPLWLFLNFTQSLSGVYFNYCTLWISHQ